MPSVTRHHGTEQGGERYSLECGRSGVSDESTVLWKSWERAERLWLFVIGIMNGVIMGNQP